MTSETMALVRDPVSDEEIVQCVIAGNLTLFEVLMRRHNQRIARAVRAILGRDDEVEDVMQQAYLNAYEHLHQFAGDARFVTWLTRIAVNEALARRRKGERFFRDGDDEMTIASLESAVPDPEQQAAGSELREAMEREVEALPDAFRVIVVMRDVEGLSTGETAASLGISEDLVKTRLHRARTMLRDNLYRRVGVTLESVFAFGNARCDRVVAAVMSSIAV